MLTYGKKKIDLFLSPCTKVKWIKDLHIKPDTLKLEDGLEELKGFAVLCEE